jgi:DNA-binding CsgD family transcriptional regulator/tetratricopeptide (TPR) repeat protein
MSSAPPTPPPFVRPQPAPLRGREALVDELVDVARRAAGGHGSARTIVGDAGVGKSSVIDEVARRLTASPIGFDVVRLKGLEAEVEMAWSGLAGLLDRHLDRVAALPPARGAAINAALALTGPNGPVEPFAVAVAARDLITEAAEAAPFVVLVDDLPWIDLSSRLVLSYIAEHLDMERVTMIVSRRPVVDARADPTLDLGRVIELTGLPRDVADQLLIDVGVSSAEVRRRLIAAAGGNPLVLVEAANLLEPAERAGRAVLPDPLPVGRNGQRMAELVLERLDPTLRRALVVAAADPDGDVERITTALDDAGPGAAALDDAAAARIVSLDDGKVVFRHPLIRAACYHGASRAAQRAAHRALAATLPERSPTRAWHLARATLGPDAEVADALEVAATMTAHLGAPSLAARTWEAASRLSPAADDRSRRLRLAAAAELDAGMPKEAAEMLGRAEVVAGAVSDDIIERTRRLQLRCRLPLAAGGFNRPASMLRAAARDVEDHDVDLAADLLLDAFARYIDEGGIADIIATATEAVELRGRVDDERACRIDIAEGAVLVVQGDGRGEALFDRYKEIGGPERPAEDASFLAGVVAPALGFLRRTAASDELLDALETDLRSRGAIRPLIDVLAAQAMAGHGRAFPVSLAAGLEAIELAESLGMPELATLAASAMALTSAVIGDRERCEQAAAVLATTADPERRAIGSMGLAWLALNEGRLDDSLEIYDSVLAVTGIGASVIRWEAEWVEALARAGRRDDGAAVLNELVRDGWPAAFAPAEYLRAKGFVARDEEAAYRSFERSISEAQSAGNPFTEARGRLAWGEQLRRVRRRADARGQLDRAHALFVAVGANTYADRAAAEARAAGSQSSDEVVAHRLLTPHELQIARLVVGGASTRDVAAKLFISPRTIEAHLSTIFRKLGVRNRRELSALALDDPVLQPVTSVS